MKLSFLLLILPLCLAHCPEDHFKDDVFKKCTKCTPCHVTLTPCTSEKDAVCAPFKESSSNHRFLKNRMHFFDDTVYDSLEEEYHAKNFLSHDKEKDHVKKNSKHLKSKHDDKHHHKKKHYEFDDNDDANDDDIDESYDNYNDDFDFNFEKVDKPKKHKKHYEFTKKHFNKKLGELLPSDEDYEDEKLDLLPEKNIKKNKKKSNHQKKVDEEELEELLLQSQKNFKIHKDHLLKNLKDEKGVEKLNKVRLNSPVLDFGSEESYDFEKHSRNPKGKKMSDSDALKALADLHDDDSDLYSILPNINEKMYKPAPAKHKVKSSNQIIGQGKEVDDMLRAEMGKNFIYEKPKFSVIPFVVENTHTEKNVYSEEYQPSSFYKKKLGWDTKNESEEDREIKTNEVVSLPFTAAETLVWDWQAVAVASAVASCLVFFLVVAIYFIINTRQWKKVNKTYNRELEEVTTRIALMQPMLDLSSSESPNASLFMKNVIAPHIEEGKKDVKV